jgi:hypothetical protein
MSGANLTYALLELGERGCGGRFVSVVDRDLPTAAGQRYSTNVDLAYVRTFSFLVINTGPCPVSAVPQLSPDGAFWGSFGELSYDILDSHLFVPSFFLRYARIAYNSAVPGCDSAITVWLHGQGL